MADQLIAPPLTCAPASSVDPDDIINWPLEQNRSNTIFVCRACGDEARFQDGDPRKHWGCAKCKVATMCVSIYFVSRNERKEAA